MSLARCCGSVLVVCCALLPAARARAQEVDPACATAYAKGQDDRLAGRLFDARTSFLRCSRPACPEAVAHDCAAWAAEVEADLPTVMLHVTDTAGRAVPAGRVFVAGAVVASRLPERPIVLEAGPHSLRFEAAGYDTATVQTALRPTDRELPVRVTLYTPDERARLNARPAPPSSRVPTLSLMLAGVGAVALGTSAYFGLSARSQYQDLEESCAPGCPRADADAVESTALIADVALATSLTALGAAAWVFFAAPAKPAAPRAAVRVSPRLRGADASVRVTF